MASESALHLVLSHTSEEGLVFVFTLTKLVLVLLLSSSGMGRNTARATQFANMVSKMMISKVLNEETQNHNKRKGGAQDWEHRSMNFQES